MWIISRYKIRGRQKKRLMDCVRVDISKKAVTTKMTADGVSGRTIHVVPAPREVG